MCNPFGGGVKVSGNGDRVRPYIWTDSSILKSYRIVFDANITHEF